MCIRDRGERVRQVKENACTLSNLYYYDSTLHSYLERMDAGEQEELAPEFEAYMERLTSQYQNSFYESGRQFQVTLALEKGGGYCMVHTPEHVDGGYMSPKTKIWYKNCLLYTSRCCLPWQSQLPCL